MRKESKVRALNAVRAMKRIGISEDKVKPVLKNLLKLFDKNWAPIEEENYRALADAIFDREEAEAAEGSTNIANSEVPEHSQKIVNSEKEETTEEKAHGIEEPEQPLKRSRVRYRNDETSSSIPSKTIEEPNKIPETQLSHRIVMKSPDSKGGNTVVELQNVTCQSSCSDKGKRPIFPEPFIPNGVEKIQQNIPLRIDPRSPSHRMTLRDRGNGYGYPQSQPRKKRIKKHALNKPKDQTVHDGSLLNELPTANTDSSIRAESSCKNGTIRGNDVPSVHSMGVIRIQNGIALPNELRINGDIGVTSGAKGSFFSSNGAIDAQLQVALPLPETPLISSPSNGMNDDSQPNNIANGDDNKTNRQNQANCAEKTNDAIDIAKGQENVIITLVNEVNDESPPSFFYIPQNAIYQNAYVNLSLSRMGDKSICSTCTGDCLALSVPCACSYETGGEFAYTTDGLVKEELLKECISMNRDPKKHCQFYCNECVLERPKNEDTIGPCKGHLVRKFIKECWWKCGCSKQCGNRVVQRGITRKLQVFMTPGGKGWGLRTLEDLPKGAFVCEYVGEVLTNAELFDRVSRTPKGVKHSYPVLLDADWGAEGVLKDEEALCLDATYFGNVARFINHRCYDSTMVEIPVEVETPDHHYYRLAFFTTRKVKALEELTWDYGIDFDDLEHPIKAFDCRCGSKFCRNIKHSNRSRSRRRRW